MTGAGAAVATPTAAADRAAPAVPAPVPTGTPVDAADRGRTRIADRVVEKIAARACTEIDRATGVPRQFLGIRLGSIGPGTPGRVDADVAGGVVAVRLSMAVQWPASVRAVTRQVRGHVTERLEALTGMRVAQIDIDVPVLPSGADDEDRRVL